MGALSSCIKQDPCQTSPHMHDELEDKSMSAWHALWDWMRMLAVSAAASWPGSLESDDGHALDDPVSSNLGHFAGLLEPCEVLYPWPWCITTMTQMARHMTASGPR